VFAFYQKLTSVLLVHFEVTAQILEQITHFTLKIVSNVCSGFIGSS